MVDLSDNCGLRQKFLGLFFPRMFMPREQKKSPRPLERIVAQGVRLCEVPECDHFPMYATRLSSGVPWQGSSERTDWMMDIEHLKQWIGREEIGTEEVSVELVRRFEATFDRAVDPQPGDPAPLLIHFCIAPSAQPMQALGRDGHPARGGFLPPVSLPRRMWAGGSFTFHDDLRVGEIVTRRSIIRDIVAKTGQTGRLCFVAVEHQMSAGGRAVLTECQDIVYRGEANEVAAEPAVEPAPQGDHQRCITPTPTLLFRYSALTFNGHRIHYDAPYAREVEGYPGLVVHGPMLATLLCQFAADLAGKRPSSFVFRSISTLFDEANILLHAGNIGTGLRLWASRPDGPVAMKATATF